MAEMIPRALVDLALANLTSGLSKNLDALKSNINAAWGRLTEARKTAKKARDDRYETAEKDQKRKRDAEITAYKGESGKPEGPSFESHKQKLASIDDAFDREKARDDDLYNKDCAAAEDEFREKSKEYIDVFLKSVNSTLGTFQSAHP